MKTAARATSRPQGGGCLNAPVRAGRPFAVLALLAAIVLAGCQPAAPASPTESGQPASPDPGSLVKVAGDEQCDLPGEFFGEPLVVRVLAEEERRLLGERDTRTPLAGHTVRFSLQDDKGYGPADDGDQGETTPPHEPGELPPYPTLLVADPHEALRRGTSAAEGLPEQHVVTDRRGEARVWVRAGAVRGDWRVEASVERSRPKKDLDEHFRVACGIVKVDELREANVGEKIPLHVRLAEWDGSKNRLRGLEERVVVFRVVGQPDGVGRPAEIRNPRDATNEEGFRKGGTEIELGDRPGTYRVLAEVEPYYEEPETTSGGDEAPGRQRGESPAAVAVDPPLRGVVFEVVAMDWFRITMAWLSGALLFLLGIRSFSSGFVQTVGHRLRLESEFWTHGRLFGYSCGAVAGACFQSWSTLLGYLLSFASGGMMSALSALPLILGAAVGATLLPQILSLDLPFLSAPLLGFGLLLLVLPRGKGTHSWGWLLLGAGLMVLAWSILSRAAEEVALSQRFREGLASILSDGPAGSWARLLGYTNFFVAAVLAGMLLRTSNLIVVVTILLAANDVIAPRAALPLVFGANLGSALAAWVRSTLKQREARRIASAAVVFQGVTALGMSLLTIICVQGVPVSLWLVEWLTPGVVVHPTPDRAGHHVAMAHTLHNLLGGGLCLLAPGIVLRVADRLAGRRGAQEEIKPHRLEPNLIPVPFLALRQASEEVSYLVDVCSKAIAEAFESFRYGDPKLSDHVIRRIETILGLHRDIARYLVLVGENELSRHDSSRLEILQTASNGLARIGECAERLRDLTMRRVEERIESLEETDHDLGEVYDLLNSQFENVLILLRGSNPRVEENALKVVERIARFRSRLETQWRQRLEQSEERGGRELSVHLQALFYQEAFDLLFRVAGHLAHIAERMRLLSPERL